MPVVAVPACASPGEVLKAVKDLATTMYNHDKLMKLAFDDIGSLSMSAIDKARASHAIDVQAGASWGAGPARKKRWCRQEAMD